MTAELRCLRQEACYLSACQVLPSHTHDGGHLAMKQKMGASSIGRGENEISEIYRKMAITRVADAAVNALADPLE